MLFRRDKDVDIYKDLRVAHSHGLLPTARVTHGREVVYKTVGITKVHALGRAAKWARERSTGFVYVMKWGQARRSWLGTPLPAWGPDHEQ